MFIMDTLLVIVDLFILIITLLAYVFAGRSFV